MTEFRIGIIGLGKIAQDQHVPVINQSSVFTLAAVASRRGVKLGDGVPTFRTPTAMYEALPELDAVAVCTPPQARYAAAREALAAGKHVLLEKPPATTLGELAELRQLAQAQGRVLFTTWHSQYNRAVATARDALRTETLTKLEVTWKEDVRRWHPGQRWIWTAGGFGVFDPGINALSIVSRISPQTMFVRAADLLFPSNCDAPIAATLTLATATSADGTFRAEFDWRQEGEQTWDIELETGSGRSFRLSRGGTCLAIDGELVVDEPAREYEGIYEHFTDLLRAGRGDIDEQPLRLVADAFLVGRRLSTEPFEE